MKHKIVFSLIALSGSLFAAAGPSSPYIEKNIREIPQDGISQMMNGEYNNLIIKFSAGDSFPLALDVGGSLFGLQKKEGSAYRLVFKRDMYVCLPKPNEILFSTDKKRWQPFMEFITGNLSVQTAYDEHTGELAGEISFVADKR